MQGVAWADPRYLRNNRILKGLEGALVKQCDSMGVRAGDGKWVVGGIEATPTPGCFWQRVRKVQKILGICEIVN